MAHDTITLTLPAAIAQDVPAMAQGLLERMHQLLERNTDGTLTDQERGQLEGLVEMAQFAQILATAVQGTAR